MTELSLSQPIPPSERWIVLGVEGEIDMATVPELEKAVDDVFASDSVNLALDLTGTAFMDSTGLRLLVSTDRRFKEANREFVVAVRAGPVSRLFDLSGVRSSLSVVEDIEELAED